MSKRVIIIVILLLGVTRSAIAASSPRDVIPAPISCEIGKGMFNFPAAATYRISGEDRDGALRRYLSVCPLHFREAGKGEKPTVSISLTDKSVSGAEAFRLEITGTGVKIGSKVNAGAFYAIQALIQMYAVSPQMSCCKIEDSPACSYRGAMFDLSRHFRDKDFIIKQIDALALLRVNNLHLHLTDDAGWRLELESFPDLTAKTAWRWGKTWTDWTKTGMSYSTEEQEGAYGGYLTKADVREIIAYAADRYINIVPEIEMPGHSREVLYAHPELRCGGVDGKALNSEICPGKEESYEFCEKILIEMMDLFPSSYIHIGGDEAAKSAWKQCPDCRKKMEEEGLRDVDELQSYFVKRIGSFIASKGRRMIGWDEIIEGGLAPGAIVMSWRGSEPGIKAMQMGHEVIMSPSTHFYINAKQDSPILASPGMGNYLPLSKVYNYDAASIGKPLGYQANLWAEYVVEDEEYEYLLYPRMAALAEIAWGKRPDAEYGQFRERAISLCDWLRSQGFNVFDLRKEFGERPESKSPIRHLAAGCPVKFLGTTYHEKYPAKGDRSLTDGERGGWAYGDGVWQGFLGDMDVVIDLGKPTQIHYLTASFLSQESVWIGFPESVEYLVSSDGVNYTSVGTVFSQVGARTSGYMQFGTDADVTARYVRLKAKRADLPQNDWLFIDEIIVK